jgi:hypothetical protein
MKYSRVGCLMVGVRLTFLQPLVSEPQGLDGQKPEESHTHFTGQGLQAHPR